MRMPKHMHHSRESSLTQSLRCYAQGPNPARLLAYRWEAQKIRREALSEIARGSPFVMEGAVVDEMRTSPEDRPDEPDGHSTLVLEVNGDG